MDPKISGVDVDPRSKMAQLADAAQTIARESGVTVQDVVETAKEVGGEFASEIVQHAGHAWKYVQEKTADGVEHIQDTAGEALGNFSEETRQSSGFKAGLLGMAMGAVLTGGNLPVALVAGLVASVVWPRLNGCEKGNILTGVGVSMAMALAYTAFPTLIGANLFSAATAASASVVSTLFTKALGPLIAKLRNSETLNWKEDTARKLGASILTGAVMGITGAATPHAALSAIVNLIIGVGQGIFNPGRQVNPSEASATFAV